MSQIIVKPQREIEAFNSLSPAQQYYVKLKDEPQLKSLSDPELMVFCVDVITRAHTTISPQRPIEDQALQFQSQELFKDIKRKFTTLTKSEVNECFTLGLRNEFGQYYGLCPPTYHLFLNSWLKKEERGRAWNDYVAKVNGWKLADKPIIPKSFYFNACEEAYKDYKEKKKLPFTPASIYDYTAEYLEMETLIDLMDWEDIKKKAKEDYLNEIKKLPKETTREWTMDPKENKVLARSIKLISLIYFYESQIKLKKERLK